MYVLWIGLLDILYVDQVDRRAAYVIRVLMLDILSVDHGGRHIYVDHGVDHVDQTD